MRNKEIEKLITGLVTRRTEELRSEIAYLLKNVDYTESEIYSVFQDQELVY